MRVHQRPVIDEAGSNLLRIFCPEQTRGGLWWQENPDDGEPVACGRRNAREEHV